MVMSMFGFISTTCMSFFIEVSRSEITYLPKMNVYIPTAEDHMHFMTSTRILISNYTDTVYNHR